MFMFLIKTQKKIPFRSKIETKYERKKKETERLVRKHQKKRCFNVFANGGGAGGGAWEWVMSSVTYKSVLN